MQEYIGSNKIKENKYKILRMSLLLGSDENREETLNNFEDAAYEIDAMNDEIYQNDLAGKFYETKTLEDEEKKLTVLVDYIGGRVEQRISLLTDFSNITGYDLQNLPPIKYYDRLDDYKERLKYIREYLDNNNKLITLKEEVKEANEKLEKAYKNKETSEEFNYKNEEILYNKFKSTIRTLDYANDITEENIDEKLNEAIRNADESKKSLDIFAKSFTTLMNAGINTDEEKEYHSYVVNAQDVYYENKEKEYILMLYKYLLTNESEYNEILLKRDNIHNLLYERLNVRNELSISNNDILSPLYELMEKQYEDINHQKENIEDIANLNEIIQRRKEEINELEIDNQKVEILALLREYGLIDTYQTEEPAEEPKKEEIIEEKKKEEPAGITSFELPKEETSMSFDNNNQKENDIFARQEESTFELPKEEENKVELPNIPDNKTSDIFDMNTTINVEPVENPITVDETPSDNQVIKVDESTNIDLDLIHSKANKVMQRVGEMLGIKPKEEIITVKEEKTEENTNNPLFESTPAPTIPEPAIEPAPIAKEPSTPVAEETTKMEEPLTTTNEETSDENNFWFPSETPDALNELPDLEVNNNNPNNFFSNNPMPDLNFPDMNASIGNNNEEVQS